MKLKGVCSKCKKTGSLSISKGRMFCENCLKTCYFCGRKKVVFKFVTPKKPICKDCNSKRIKQKEKRKNCIICKQEKPIYAFGRCQACYLKKWREERDQKKTRIVTNFEKKQTKEV